MAGLFAIPAWPSPAARQQTQYPSISDKPIRFDSLRVMKKGRWEPFGITPSQEPLSLLAEGQLQPSHTPHGVVIHNTPGTRAVPKHRPLVG